MLANPQPDHPAYSLVMNREDFQFIKLIKQEQPMYALSDRFSLYRRENELYKVLNILKNRSDFELVYVLKKITIENYNLIFL